MSSEDSQSEDETLHRRPLRWLKKKYRKSLHDLDKLYYGQLSRKAKIMMRKRTDGTISNRPKPDDAPDSLTASSDVNDSTEA